MSTAKTGSAFLIAILVAVVWSCAGIARMHAQMQQTATQDSTSTTPSSPDATAYSSTVNPARKGQFRNHSQDAGGIEDGSKRRKLGVGKRKFWDESSARRSLARRRRRIDGSSKLGFHAEFCGEEFSLYRTPRVGYRGSGISKFSW